MLCNIKAIDGHDDEVRQGRAKKPRHHNRGSRLTVTCQGANVSNLTDKPTTCSQSCNNRFPAGFYNLRSGPREDDQGIVALDKRPRTTTGPRSNVSQCGGTHDGGESDVHQQPSAISVIQPPQTCNNDLQYVDPGISNSLCCPSADASSVASSQNLVARPTSRAYQLYRQLLQQAGSAHWLEGSRVWVKTPGYCAWPAIVFPLHCCRKSELPDLLASHRPGSVLVQFYGSHDYQWATPTAIIPWGDVAERQSRMTALKAYGRKAGSAALVSATISELQGSRSQDGEDCTTGDEDVPPPAQELQRFLELWRSVLAKQQHSGPSSGKRTGKKGPTERRAMCGVCRESGTQMSCRSCGKVFHTLCLEHPDISPEHMLEAAEIANAAAAAQASAAARWLDGLITATTGFEILSDGSRMLTTPYATSAADDQQWLLPDHRPSGLTVLPIIPPGVNNEAGQGNALIGTPSQGSTVEETVLGGIVSWGGPGVATHTAAGQVVGGPALATSPGASLRVTWRCPGCGSEEQIEQLLTQTANNGRGGDHSRASPRKLSSTKQSAGAASTAGGPAAGQQGSSPVGAPSTCIQLPEQPPAAPADLLDLLEILLKWETARDEGAVVNGELAVVERMPPAGTRLWVKTPGYCAWPAIVFPLRCCRKLELSDLLASYTPGSVLVHFYGEHNHMWLPEGELSAALAKPEMEEGRRTAFVAWSGRQRRRGPTAKVALDQLAGAASQPADEIVRVCALRDAVLAAEQEAMLAAELWGNNEGGSSEGAVESDVGPSRSSAGVGTARESPVGAGGPRSGLCGGWRIWLGLCAVCEEPGGQVRCLACRRSFHTLCLTPRCLSPECMPTGATWTCPSCASINKKQDAVEDRPTGEVAGEQCALSKGSSDQGASERLGLTPDWIIYAAAFLVMQLPRPTADMPYIRGLLDPCTNSKTHPNIPAEKLYDKSDDGLRLSNSWSGYYVLLNPEYTAQTQWRFVNRAIDEVESGSVPAVLLVCRNSTDTAYFQRLRPYPRVMLRRTSARFKDYDKTPIGFGVAVFCICRRGPTRTPLYSRFIATFAAWGEPNIPIDTSEIAIERLTFVNTTEFSQLLDRLTEHTERHMRDNWVQCSACQKWRIVPYDLFRTVLPSRPQAAGSSGRTTGAAEWTCSQLGFGNCERPQTRAEAAGVHYTRLRRPKGASVAAKTTSCSELHLAPAASEQIAWQQHHAAETVVNGGEMTGEVASAAVGQQEESEVQESGCVDLMQQAIVMLHHQASVAGPEVHDSAGDDSLYLSTGHLGDQMAEAVLKTWESTVLEVGSSRGPLEEAAGSNNHDNPPQRVVIVEPADQSLRYGSKPDDVSLDNGGSARGPDGAWQPAGSSVFSSSEVLI